MISNHCVSTFLGIGTANNDLRCSFVVHGKAFKQSWSSLVVLRNVEYFVARSSSLKLNGARAISTGVGREITDDFTPSTLAPTNANINIIIFNHSPPNFWSRFINYQLT
jgi:hypothetical protein